MSQHRATTISQLKHNRLMFINFLSKSMLWTHFSSSFSESFSEFSLFFRAYLLCLLCGWNSWFARMFMQNKRMWKRATVAGDGYSVCPTMEWRNSSPFFISTDFKYQCASTHFSQRMDKLPIHERRVNIIHTHTHFSITHIYIFPFARRKIKREQTFFSNCPQSLSSEYIILVSFRFDCHCSYVGSQTSPNISNTFASQQLERLIETYSFRRSSLYCYT